MREGVLQIDDCAPGLRVVGCGCPWAGTTDTMVTCDDGVLTPGDPCPAGRCPECFGLVYLDRPEDRAVLEAGRLLAAARVIVDTRTRSEGYCAALGDLRAILARIDAHD